VYDYDVRSLKHFAVLDASLCAANYKLMRLSPLTNVNRYSVAIWLDYETVFKNAWI